MKQGTGSGFNTKLYTIAASYTTTKSTENISHGCAFRGGIDAAIVYNFVLKPDPVPCFMTF